MNGANNSSDNNGNLLSDGVNTYTYDQANRLTSVNSHTSNVSFAYNGVGDRLQQTIDGVTTNYALDLNTGLTQVLADGTNNYLYGVGRIAQYDTAMQYFGADGLGSARQIYNAAGVVRRNTLYDPFGNVLTTNGTLASVYGFTGEQTDATGLVYLRARYYAPTQGRFATRDTWRGSALNPQSQNLYQYTRANPTNLTDPTGYDPGIQGPAAFFLCFDLHSGTQGTLAQTASDGQMGVISAQQAINICKAAYSKANWSFDLKSQLPTSASDLFGWYINNYRGENNTDHLYFDSNQPLTKELVKSILIHEIRLKHYREGDTVQPMEKRFNYIEQIESLLYDTRNVGKASPPITAYLGSFLYQVKTLENGSRIGFRIDNDTTLASGTHIVGRFPDDGYTQNVEDLVADDPSIGQQPLYKVIQENPVSSILRSRTRDNIEDGLGGATLWQTFTWTEKRDECLLQLDYQRMISLLPAMDKLLDIQVWSDFRARTTNPVGYPE